MYNTYIDFHRKCIFWKFCAKISNFLHQSKIRFFETLKLRHRESASITSETSALNGTRPRPGSGIRNSSRSFCSITQPSSLPPKGPTGGKLDTSWNQAAALKHSDSKECRYHLQHPEQAKHLPHLHLTSCHMRLRYPRVCVCVIIYYMARWRELYTALSCF